MVSKNFNVRIGLSVGVASIDALTGNITTPGLLSAGSGAFTGAVTAPTAATADSSTTLATTAFVKAQGYQTSAGAAATNIAGGSAGQVPYQSAVNTTLFTAAGTSGQVLTSSGTGAPTWTTVSGGGGSVTVTDDTSTAASYYPVFATATSGTVSSIKTSSTKLQFNPSNGTLFATIFQSLSDERLKTNVQPIANAYSVVAKLNGVGYDWIDGSGAQYGFIAQQVETVLPEIVGYTGEYKTVNYSGVIPFLVEAMKQQQAIIDTLLARVTALEGK